MNQDKTTINILPWKLENALNRIDLELGSTLNNLDVLIPHGSDKIHLSIAQIYHPNGIEMNSNEPTLWSRLQCFNPQVIIPLYSRESKVYHKVSNEVLKDAYERRETFQKNLVQLQPDATIQYDNNGVATISTHQMPDVSIASDSKLVNDILSALKYGVSSSTTC
jgi:hypothetical protein